MNIGKIIGLFLLLSLFFTGCVTSKEPTNEEVLNWDLDKQKEFCLSKLKGKTYNQFLERYGISRELEKSKKPSDKLKFKKQVEKILSETNEFTCAVLAINEYEIHENDKNYKLNNFNHAEEYFKNKSIKEEYNKAKKYISLEIKALEYNIESEKKNSN